MIKYILLTQFGTSDKWNEYGKPFNSTCEGILAMCRACMLLARHGYENYNIDIKVVDE